MGHQSFFCICLFFFKLLLSFQRFAVVHVFFSRFVLQHPDIVVRCSKQITTLEHYIFNIWSKKRQHDELLLCDTHTHRIRLSFARKFCSHFLLFRFSIRLLPISYCCVIGIGNEIHKPSEWAIGTLRIRRIKTLARTFDFSKIISNEPTKNSEKMFINYYSERY